MLKDIQIALRAKKVLIKEIAKKLDIKEKDLILYGSYKAKFAPLTVKRILRQKATGKLVLVTAINPTPAGEGKTTIAIGLSQALNKCGLKSIITLREPSMGPVFGLKGGATGGGFSQILPMDDINLHFTGDIHAVTSAVNLLCAMVDNHIYHGNKLDIDPKEILIKRCLDVNDRSLRKTVIGLGPKINGLPRENNFEITVASEVMAILCLSENIQDLKTKLGEIIVGYTYDKKAVFAKDLKADGAMTVILRDAILPNLVQTTENTPAIVHGGPFANIAHGCNSIIATKLGIRLSKICVTEAGFGADLGAEKFFDIKCRLANLKPDAVVLVATIKALKYNGGVKKDDLKKENTRALKKGLTNLLAHIENLKKFNITPIVTLNKFLEDTKNEIRILKIFCEKEKVRLAISEAFVKGSNGCKKLAQLVLNVTKTKNNFKFLYKVDLPIKKKIEIISTKIYGAKKVVYTKKAEESILNIKRLKKENIPVCIAKTQSSLSDDPNLLGKPTSFTVTVKNITLSNGAGFIVVYLGDILTMPGLPETPAAETIDIGKNLEPTGLF
jgi:formate--tetrahydrofolate ligase